mmetsp:Transcript_13692/g.33499  ORF Transcript_13692/g.33499 Transcript_13692/m.33499 type:complete len:295 (-) Transcript_13692:472-1356(-)
MPREELCDAMVCRAYEGLEPLLEGVREVAVPKKGMGDDLVQLLFVSEQLSNHPLLLLLGHLHHLWVGPREVRGSHNHCPCDLYVPQERGLQLRQRVDPGEELVHEGEVLLGVALDEDADAGPHELVDMRRDERLLDGPGKVRARSLDEVRLDPSFLGVQALGHVLEILRHGHTPCQAGALGLEESPGVLEKAALEVGGVDLQVGQHLQDGPEERSVRNVPPLPVPLDRLEGGPHDVLKHPRVRYEAVPQERQPHAPQGRKTRVRQDEGAVEVEEYALNDGELLAVVLPNPSDAP